ncbi:MAG: glycogen synthase GlgA [Christensenellaceae bacterium]|jgi:starch synthase|nr:glycogen synthase GlgA [Christensenellaceae bacterium]
MEDNKSKKPARPTPAADIAATPKKPAPQPAIKAGEQAAPSKPPRAPKAVEPPDPAEAKPPKAAKPAKATAAKAEPKQPAAPRGPLKILIAASECVPFIKTGGLADVIGALPRELAKLGAEVRVICPKYAAIPENYKQRMSHVCEFPVPLGWRSQYCGIEVLEEDGIIYYFVDNEYYFGRGYVYGEFSNEEAERFAFFSKAVLDCMPHIGFFPHVLHAHDWQAAMSIVLLKLQYDCLPEYAGIRTVFTIHNLRYQGVFEWPFVDDLLTLGGGCFRPDCLEYFGKVNYMKGALVFADAVTTVSPSYAGEIQSAEYGETLDGVLRMRGRVSGILNGLDESLYNPETDPHIAARYTADDAAGKAACKRDLQEKFHLEQDATVPVLGLVTRLTGQKGLDLIEYAMGQLMELRMQMVILGSGEARYEQLFSWASWRWPGRVGTWFGQNSELASVVYAGSDLFLMPSQFEPCGLAQMIALRYGTIPLVRETGGLKDTIQPYNKFTGEGLGFTFTQYDMWDMLGGLNRALELWYDYPEAWKALMHRAMRTHFTWDKSAQRYMSLYEEL